MDFELLYGIVKIILIATTPLVFAGIGELVTEKSGVLNLGVEGMMLVGAVSAFVTLVITGSYILAFLVSILSGILMSGLFAYLVLILMFLDYLQGLCRFLYRPCWLQQLQIRYFLLVLLFPLLSHVVLR